MSTNNIDPATYDFPPGMSQPSLQALLNAGITSMEQIAAATPKELLALHGMGPKGIRILREGLAARGLAFAGEEPRL